MRTKFIGIDGYGEIETLKTTRKVKKNYGKKVVKLVKLSTLAVTDSFKAPKTKNKKTTPVLDACYRNARQGNNEFEIKVLDFSSFKRIQKTNKKKAYTVHYARANSQVSGNFLRNKAVFGAVGACAASALVVLTAVTSVGADLTVDQEQKTNLGLTSAVAQNNETENLKSVSPMPTSGSESGEMYNTIAKAVSNDNIKTNCYGLYVDGEYIGSVLNEYDIYNELDSILSYAKDKFDDENASVNYENEIDVRQDDYSSENITTASDLVNKAYDKLVVAITTEVTSEEEIPYETETKEDDTKDTSYEEVETKGENGLKKITEKVTYINGEYSNETQVSSETVKEPVNEVVVKGTKKATSSSSSSSSTQSSAGFIWPVSFTHNITSPYGARWGTFHYGIDISDSGAYGQSILAAASGTVTWAGYDNSGYGNYVIIDHGNGYSTVYGHCSSLSVTTGQTVTQGQVIAAIGSTGDSTGPHLHFEVRQGSERLNPSNFVS